MRSLSALALCLGLFAVVQAAAMPSPSKYGSVLLEGAIADEDTPATGPGSSNVLWGQRNWKRHNNRHESPAYWQERHSNKAKLLRCANHAVSQFNMTDAETWKPAGKALSGCLFSFLKHCHDAPGLPADFTKSVPWVMFMNALDVLTAEGNDGLLHATTVMEFYVAGGYEFIPGTTPPQANPWYTGKDSCASTLVTLLDSACKYAGLHKDQGVIWALARMVVKLMEKGLLSNNGDELEKCLPDIPAVILALTSTYCPASGILFNPLNDTALTCTPDPNAPLYEDGAGALLGGSIISLLLLSGNQKLAALGVQVAFAANRQALAATQTTTFANCLSSNPPSVPPTYDGELAAALANVPEYSGAVAGYQAATPLPLGPDGQRLLCSAIAMMSGGYGPGAPVHGSTWLNNQLWQGNANILNAVFKTIALGTPPAADPPTVVITPQQVQGLCATAKAVWTFTNDKPAGSTTMYVTVPAASPPYANEEPYPCLTSDTACTTRPSWLATADAQLETGHTLGAGSPVATVCQW